MALLLLLPIQHEPSRRYCHRRTDRYGPTLERRIETDAKKQLGDTLLPSRQWHLKEDHCRRHHPLLLPEAAGFHTLAPRPAQTSCDRIMDLEEVIDRRCPVRRISVPRRRNCYPELPIVLLPPMSTLRQAMLQVWVQEPLPRLPTCRLAVSPLTQAVCTTGNGQTLYDLVLRLGRRLLAVVDQDQDE